MCVIVTVLETGLVKMLVSVCPIIVSVFVHDVLVIVAGVGVVVHIFAMSVLVVVWCCVFMFCTHRLASFSLGVCALKLGLPCPTPFAET